MKRWSLFAIGVAAIWIARETPAPSPSRAARPEAIPETISVGTESAALPAKSESESVEKVRETKEEYQRRRRELYDAMLERLIQSIDWTRADSRARFPLECALLEADFGPVDE